MTFVVNAPETSFSIDFERTATPAVSAVSSPIDSFYEQRKLALMLSSSPLLGVDSLRGLALIPVFAAAEMYFRRFIARAVQVCPLCAEQAGTQQIAFGATQSLDKSERAFAIGEHQGFTSEGEIAKRTNKVLGIDVLKNASLKAAIAEFETACHLRHALVHCGGELMYLNRRNLGITKAGRLTIEVPVAEFQGVVLKISNVVRAYNSSVGAELFRRWFRDGYLTGKWAADRYKAGRLIEMLWSSEDLGGAPDLRSLYLAIKATV